MNHDEDLSSLDYECDLNTHIKILLMVSSTIIIPLAPLISITDPVALRSSKKKAKIGVPQIESSSKSRVQ